MGSLRSNSKFAPWIFGEQIAQLFSICSQCIHWVNGGLPPVTLGCGDWVCGGLGGCGGVPPGLRVGRSPFGGKTPWVSQPSLAVKLGSGPHVEQLSPTARYNAPTRSANGTRYPPVPYHHHHTIPGSPLLRWPELGFRRFLIFSPQPSSHPGAIPTLPYLYVLWAGPDLKPPQIEY